VLSIGVPDIPRQRLKGLVGAVLSQLAGISCFSFDQPQFRPRKKERARNEVKKRLKLMRLTHSALSATPLVPAF